MKKFSILVLILILFQFICSNYIVYAQNDPADPGDDPTQQGDEQEGYDELFGGFETMSMEEYKSITDEGIATINGTEKNISFGETGAGAAASKAGTFISTIAAAGLKVVSNLTYEGGLYYTDSDFSAQKTGLFTISSLIFGEYVLFNPKPYETSTSSGGTAPSDTTATVDSIKENAVSIGNVIRQLALALSLPMFLLALIKTITAKKASDLAAWKKILARWVLSMFLILFFQYILAAIDTAADYLIDGFWKIRLSLETGGYSSFEVTVIQDIAFQLENTGGVTFLGYAIEFVAIVILQTLFLVKYIIRAFAIIALYVMAPLIILIHSFNLMLGRDSNILGDFFKNYISLVFMQPLHVLFYLIFFFSFSEMAINVPIVGILLLYALYRANSIAKAMFGWELGSSIFSLKK